MNQLEVSRLACDKGYILQQSDTDGDPIYWIENCLFISKPFYSLNALALLLRILPVWVV
jgi:hypothetical protein